MKVNLTINIAAIIAIALAFVLGAAALHRHVDASLERQMKEDAERALANVLSHADLERGRAASIRTSLKALNEQKDERILDLEKELDAGKLEIHRKSTAVFKLEAEIKDLKANVKPAGPDKKDYGYSLPWFAFYTPDVFSRGGEVLHFNIHGRLAVSGLRSSDGGQLEAEIIELDLTDPVGRPIPLYPVLTEYTFQYAPELPQEAPWYAAVHLDLFGNVLTPYPWSIEGSRAILGARADLWGVTLSAGGMVDGKMEPAAFLGLGYNRRLF